MVTPPHERPLKILMVSSECAPFAKMGGLGDVVFALPRALHQLGHEVRVLLPLYGSIDRALHGLRPAGSACVHLPGGEAWVGVFEGFLPGPAPQVPVWFLDHGASFDRPGIYDDGGVAFGDNGPRFLLLCKAALQLCQDRGFLPDVMHAHDWPTSLVAPLLSTAPPHGPLSRTASVLTIHNIGYQGHFDRGLFDLTGIGAQHFHADAFEDHGGVNLLKAGIHFADAVTTVSPGYAREIAHPGLDHGLSRYVQQRAGDFFGILNGADYEHWDPRHDRYLPASYGPDDMSGKARCKRALQERMGLEVTAKVPILGVVSRFAEQKGVDLLCAALPEALALMHIQAVVVGSGDPESERFFRWLSKTLIGRVACHLGYSEELSHLVQAGSDFFLMPSRYEPCGLTQMYALRYGTPPIVRATGGLDDTVENYDEETGEGTGFKFHDPTPQALYNTIGWAVSTYYNRPAHLAQLRARGMAEEFSWREAAEHYVAAYRHAVAHRRAG